jgi:NAD(P)-dependent dehydrogenase (short-subunit alcohol dehydrogenase family)
MAESLSGRVIVVTGASSGIGEATARLLHAAGALPVLAARRADRLKALSEELGDALVVPTDVTDLAQVRALAEAAAARHGRVDGLVNNAGADYPGPGRIEELDPAAFLELLKVNVVGLVNGMQAVLPHLRAAGGGRIVNVTSGSTEAPRWAGSGAYVASKSAANVLSEVARLELAESNIQVTTLLPSVTSTEFGDGMFQDDAVDSAGGVDLAALGLVVHSPEYVGRIVLRALRTGEARIDVPNGPEQSDFPDADQ